MSNDQPIKYPDGSRGWFRGGVLHREDGPAIERADGGKSWWRAGLLHRDDGPAAVWPSGFGEWWRDGFSPRHPEGRIRRCWHDERGALHREDGPALERANGSKEWWLHGIPQFSCWHACDLALTARMMGELGPGILRDWRAWR